MPIHCYLSTPSLSPDAPASVLYGRSVLFCGDSICAGHYDDEPHLAWAGRIARRYGIVADNRAASGWALSTVRHPHHRILTQLLEAPEDAGYDMILLQGGVNDAWGTADGTNIIAPVGALTDGFDATPDATTFVGALEEFFHHARRRFPNALLAYTFSFAMPRATVGRVSDMEEYYAAAAAACRKWDVPYLDMYHDRHLNEEVLQISCDVCLHDAIHPNAQGYDRLAPYIGEWMESLLR